MHSDILAVGSRFGSTKLASAACDAVILAMFSAMLLVAFQPAHAQTETVLYSFGSQSGDGLQPLAGLVMDKKGNLYGTTPVGGANNSVQSCLDEGCGTVFEVTPAGKETLLYSFCSQSGCTDGSTPFAGLVMDKVGNLYGTTSGDYCNYYTPCDTVFKVTPSGTETVLYSFCSQPGCTDGLDPFAGLIMDMNGNLYGTTPFGGAYGVGTVFKVTPSGTETVLYSFCSQPNCKDGLNPFAGLVMDTVGNLYGTTIAGGANPACPGGGCGTVFKVTPSGTETVLYNFCSQPSCTDGYYPYAGLVMDKLGNLYGETYLGGSCQYNNCGTVFKLTPSGTETVLHSFCSKTNCADGANPYYGGLVMDKKGNLYGTTPVGGGNGKSCGGHGCGTVFKVTPSGREKVLYNFCSQPNCTDGSAPSGFLLRDNKGNLYGTTTNGGTNFCQGGGCGTVFKVTR